jgi:hypothetical protein
VLECIVGAGGQDPVADLRLLRSSHALIFSRNGRYV